MIQGDKVLLLIGIFITTFFGIFISKATANNDIFLQLLAIDGIIKDFDFSGVRGHPIGIATFGALIKSLELDPLIVFYWIQPIMLAGCFVIIYNLLLLEFSSNISFLISLGSLFSLILVKASNQVTAEIISLFSILVIISFAWNKLIINKEIRLQQILSLILLSWVIIFFRNASIFIIIGLIYFLFQRNLFSFYKFGIIALLMVLPGIIKALFFYDNPGNLDYILSFNFYSAFLSQIGKHISNFSEIVLPYSLHLNQYQFSKLLLGIIIFAIILVILNSKNLKNHNNRKMLGKLFFTLGISYYLFLSVSALYYNYSWGDLYRVSGFGIIFIFISFWVFVFSFIEKYNFKIWVLVFLGFLTIGKFGYGIRYESIASETRFLFYDYRNSINNIKKALPAQTKVIYILTSGPWQGENLYYMLSYFNSIYSLPFHIKKYNGTSLDKNEVLLVAEKAINKLSNYSINPTKLPEVDQILLITKIESLVNYQN